MNPKKLPLAILIAGSVLLVEFKILPLVWHGRFWKKDFLSPVEEIERIKFNLVYVLKESGVEILLGPYFKNETAGIEMVVKIKGYPLKILFSSSQEPRSQLASLQLILKESKIEESLKEGKIPKLIDLTVDKPYAAF